MASSTSVRPRIAIVGIGCRFPGGIDGPESFWRALEGGLDAIGPLPEGRYDPAPYLGGEPGAPGTMPHSDGGYLSDIDSFDAAFFGLSPREVERLDPQHRLLLECSWEALEDAGIPVSEVSGSPTGVYVGLWLQDYEARLFADPARVDFHDTTGTGRYAASGRVSHALGLQGPSITVDTACSSSLVAVHAACRALQAGDCDLALAGGANTILQPHITLAYARSGMMAPDARCKFGDARANGYVRSDGAGIVALKLLDRALEDGDAVHAVILGGAINNDGRSGDHFVNPSRAGQEEMLRLAWADAGVEPTLASFVEAHGTGTSAGDPVELGAIGTVLGAGRGAARPCLVGSVKTNFGHTEGAAGVAGLIKAALALRHGVLPASLHHETPNPAIDWDGLGVAVPTEGRPLDGDGAAVYAGVSSFGIAGTNAHIVLTASPARLSDVRRTTTDAKDDPDDPAPLLVPLSANDPAALRQRAERLASALRERSAPLDDVAHTLGPRRTALRARIHAVAASKEELLEALDLVAAEGRTPSGVEISETDTTSPVVIVFPGQGSQWAGMARRLYAAQPVFRAALDECAEEMRRFVDWDLHEVLGLEGGEPDLPADRIDVIQPTLVAVGIALFRQWRAWGVEPAAVIGHSMGEVAAAHAAGILGLEDAMRVICERSQLMLRVRGRGAMAVVEMALEETEQAISGHPGLSIAAANSPRSTVVSGDSDQIAELLAELEVREVFARPVAVDVASHSPQVDELREELLEKLAPLQPGASATSFVSTVEGRVVDGEALGPEYWVRNLREPVRFAATVEHVLESLASDGARPVFLEVSPHPVLVPAIEQTLGGRGTSLGSLRRDEDAWRTLLEAAGRLWSLGGGLDFAAVGPGDGEVLRLPPYPWQRQRYWVVPQEREAIGAGNGHGLLPRVVRSAAGNTILSGRVDLERFPFLGDHRVGGRSVLPAAALLDAAIFSAREDDGPVWIEDVRFERMVELERPVDLELTLARLSEGASEFRVHASEEDAEGATCARGRVIHSTPDTGVPAEGTSGAGTPVSDHVERMALRGLDYGPAFQGVQELAVSDDGAVASVALPTSGGDEAEAGFLIPPGLLDAALQVALACAASDEPADVTLVPVGVDRVRLLGKGRPPRDFRVRARQRGRRSADIVLSTPDGPWLALDGVGFEPIAGPADTEPAYRVAWHEAALESAEASLDRWVVAGGDWSVELVRALEAGGAAVTLMPPGEDAAVLPPALAGGPLGLVVHPPSGGVAETHDPLDAQTDGTERLLALLGLLGGGPGQSPERVCIVTHGARHVVDGDRCDGLAHAALWGMGAVLSNERPSLPVRLIDAQDVDADSIAAEVLSGDTAGRVGLRAGGRYVARLVHFDAARAETGGPARAAPAYRVSTNRPGVLDALVPTVVPRRPPGADEIEIEVAAAGLNFMNVLSALGVCPGFPNGRGPLGIECAGVVTRVGADVEDFALGQRVAAFAHESLGSHATVTKHLVMPVPDGVSLEQAAAVPIAYLTAYYGLEHLARMRKGDRVLIHSASGAVGLAAIDLARRAGAEVIATAGTEEKRTFLRGRGVEHVFDSRTLGFADAVMEATGGHGVDIVLNSLSGEAIGKGIECMAAWGRFVELGKRDIYDESSLRLGPFRRNLSFYAVDLEIAARERPELLGEMMSVLAQRWARGEFAEMPTTTTSLAEVADTFRTMAAARHVGKLVVSTPSPDAVAGDLALDRIVLDADGTYLVTGGLGALGLATARWAASRGAGEVVLVGRTPVDDDAMPAIRSIEAAGARVRTEVADVADQAAMAALLHRIEEDGGVLRGVFHAAGLLDDATLDTMSVETFRAPMKPKVSGAWALHRLTEDRDLDVFVLFSSVAGVLGTPGQANYAGANAFMDTLASHRVARGLPATSIAWGPWKQVGLAAERDDRGARLATQGLRGIAPDAGIDALERIVGSGEPFVVAGGIDPLRWTASYSPAARSGFFAELLGHSNGDGQTTGGEATVAQYLRDSPPDDRLPRLRDHLVLRLAEVLRLPTENVRATVPFKRLGMDSLMALELRNRLEEDLEIPVSATAVWNYPTVEQLAGYLRDRVWSGDGNDESGSPAVGATDTSSVMADDSATDLDALEHDDLADLLDRELAASDDLLRDGDR